jgi:hypothetical protein
VARARDRQELREALHEGEDDRLNWIHEISRWCRVADS